MTKAKRLEVTVSLGTESFYDILDSKTPQEVIAEMQNMLVAYGNRNIKFDIVPYGYDGGLELHLLETRLENDKEFAARRQLEAKFREKEKARKKTNLEKEFAEYQRLQKKFQGKSGFQ
jgi:hypothetical protein